MKKIIIIGCPGAGKSTFARRLSEITGIELHYLDMIWHTSDRRTVSREQFDKALEEIMNGDSWIIDGNYLRTLGMRLRKCDTVFLLDYPLELCMEGAVSRLGKERVDMPWSEDELDEEFRQWILDFPENQLPIIYFMLETYSEDINTVIFKTREESEEFLSDLKNSTK